MRAAVTEEIDLYRAAKVVMDQHGDEAAIYAAMRADEFIEKGDIIAASMWKLIVAKIEELSVVDAENDTLH